MPAPRDDLPLAVCAEPNAVLIDGETVCFSLTPDAALETAERLHNQAVQAIGLAKFEDAKDRMRPSA